MGSNLKKLVRARQVETGEGWAAALRHVREHAIKGRAAEKQRSREEDRRRVQSGEITPAQLRDENSFFNLSGGIRIRHFGGKGKP